jgi:sugar phosphate isomerase/epimerase
MSISHRLGCSTITFRRLPLAAALDQIRQLGFREIDLGALPGVCDHVPFTGIAVRSVNGDIGDLNRPLDAAGRRTRDAHLGRLLELTAALGGRALVLPNGALDHEPLVDLRADVDLVAAELATAARRASEHGLELWVESLHLFRLCHTVERARLLTDALDGSGVGVVLDTSHVVASGADPADVITRFGSQIRHVHLRDATPGQINLSIGNGVVDFAGTLDALDAVGYDGHLTLELETRDIADADRPSATLRAAHQISDLLERRSPSSASPALTVSTRSSS